MRGRPCPRTFFLCGHPPSRRSSSIAAPSAAATPRSGSQGYWEAWGLRGGCHPEQGSKPQLAGGALSCSGGMYLYLGAPLLLRQSVAAGRRCVCCALRLVAPPHTTSRLHFQRLLFVAAPPVRRGALPPFSALLYRYTSILPQRPSPRPHLDADSPVGRRLVAWWRLSSVTACIDKHER